MNLMRRLQRVPVAVWAAALLIVLTGIVAQRTGAIYSIIPPGSGAAAGWKAGPSYVYPAAEVPTGAHLTYDADGNAHILRSAPSPTYRWFAGGEWHEVAAPGYGPIAVAADGTVNLVFADDGDIKFSRFENGLWSPVMSVARTSGDSVNPAIALDDRGRPQVVWEDYSLGRREILFSAYSGGAWTRPYNLSASPARSSTDPAIAVGDDARIHVTWQEEDTGGSGYYDICYAGNDGSWSKPETVIAWPGDQEQPSLTVDPAGRPVIAFSDYAGGGIYVTQREGSSWLAPRLIDYDRGGGQAPSVAAAADGTLHFAWAKLVRASALSTSRVKLQVFYRTLAGDRLSPPFSLGTREGFRGESPYLVAPELALTPSGQPGVVFDDLVDGKWSNCYVQLPTPLAGTAGSRLGGWLPVILAVLLAAALIWSINDRIRNRVERSARAWYRSPVALAAGITLIVAMLWGAGAGIVSRVAAMPVSTRPAGWSAPVAVSRGPGDASSPRLAVDGDGQVHLVWAQTLGSSKRIYYRNLAADAIQTIDGESVGGSDWPAIAAANGRIYAAWQTWTPTPEVMVTELSGGSWSAPQVVFSSQSLSAMPTLQAAGNPLAGGSERPALTVSTGAGEQPVYLSWTFGSRISGDILVASRQDGNWTVPANISLNSGASDRADIVAGSDGRLHVVWSDTTLDRAVGENRGDILYRAFDGLAWGEVRNISQNGSQSTDPVVAPGADGRVNFVWVDAGFGSPLDRTLTALLGRTRPDSDPPTVVYRRMENGRLMRGRSIDVPVPHDYPQMPGAVSVAAAVDLEGRLNVVWSRFTGSDYRLYYRQLNGLRWSRVYVLAVSDKVSEPFEFQPAQPDIAVDKAGTLHVVWPMYHNGRFDIFQLERIETGKR